MNNYDDFNIKKTLPKIIMLSGAKRCGKDTVAQYLETKYGYHHIKITSKLKDCLKLLFDLNDIDLEENKEEMNERWQTTPRKMMQFIGTEMFQYQIQELIPDIEKKFWIKSLFNENLINNLINNNHYRVVISDLRFIHEFEQIKETNISSYHIRITNDRLIYEEDMHISEKELYEIPHDYEMINDSNLTDLYKSIDNLLKELYNKVFI